MFYLTDIFNKDKDSFDYKGNVLSIDMTFDTILRLFDMFDDKELPEYEKVLIALEMLVNEFELIEDLPLDEMLELYKFILKGFLDIDTDKKDSEKGTPGEDEPIKKVMDFKKDATLIYASFLSEYKMDLFEVQDKLHWDKFSALLSNLGDKTAFKQVVSYRTMKVPSAKEASEEYRSHIQKMKRVYSLEDEEYKAKSMESTLNTIASTFKK